jgi:hypothetical protein
MNLYASTIMNVKKTNNYLRYLYANVKKTNNYLRNLYASIAMNVKKINNYLQDLYASIAMNVKKPTIYKTYMWVLHIWNNFMKIIIFGYWKFP